MSSRPTPITRLAPSPTGALHLGNARTFVINWAMARQQGWRIVLRIEDLDGPRIKPEASQQAIELLQWLGLDWDTGPIYQSQDLAVYERALTELHQRGLVYRCRCTRRDIEQAQSAPHAEDEPTGPELRYPGTCRDVAEAAESAVGAVRPRLEAGMVEHAWRLRVPNEPVAFEDAFAGPRSINVQQQVGDFVVATKQGLPAYQLAVVVDDARQGVSEVVRGDDLLDSTARQLLVYRLLGLGPLPRYTHLPLVLGPDGRRLAKRHGDTRLIRYKDAGVSAERVMGLLAYWSGVVDRPRAMDAAGFAAGFDLARLGREPVWLSEDDERWLSSGVKDA